MFGITHRVVGMVGASLLALTLMTGCGTSGPTKVSVTLRDMVMDVSAATAKAGKVTFDVKNISPSTVHEMVVLKTDITNDKLPTQSDGTVDEAKLQSMGETGDLAAGASNSITFDLPAGHYDLICNKPGHYTAKMYQEFTVTP